MGWETAAAIIVVGLTYTLYKAGVELDEEHWPAKMALFYLALALGWSAANLTVRMARDNTASAGLIQSFEIFYYAWNIAGLFMVGYAMYRVLGWLFFRAAKPGDTVPGYTKGW